MSRWRQWFRVVLVASILTAGALALLMRTPWAPVLVVSVSGQCMEPTLRHGDVLVAVRGQAEPGRIIIARLPDGILVKRVHWSGGESGQFCCEELEEEGRTPWQRGQR